LSQCKPEVGQGARYLVSSHSFSHAVAVGWEAFSYIQAAGFFLLALGTLIYNGFVRWPSCWARKPWQRDDLTAASLVVMMWCSAGSQ
jgi:hypothetical protein